MACKDPPALPSDDVPGAYVGIVAPGNERSSSGREGTNCVFMTFQVKLVVWVLVYDLLHKYDISQGAVSE